MSDDERVGALHAPKVCARSLTAAWGYEIVLLNFDQVPYNHNESGSQNKMTLGVPIVEGNGDCRLRWTANLTMCSDVTAVAAGKIPPAECMFKGTRGGRIHSRFQEHRRANGFPAWFIVSVSEKGSYRVKMVAFLKVHLGEWKPGRFWRIASILLNRHRAHCGRSSRWMKHIFKGETRPHIAA